MQSWPAAPFATLPQRGRERGWVRAAVFPIPLRKRAGWGLAPILCLLFATTAPARADLWAYIDANGVAHVAPEKRDARYELFFRSGDPGTRTLGKARDSMADAAQEASAAVAASQATLAPRLQALFDVSPGYKAARPHLREAAARHRIDYELLKALIVAESGFDPRAVSPKGAVGLMQVMPPTGERWGLRANARTPVAQQLTDPATNVRIGTRYLRHLIDLFPGRLDLALAAYNAGEGAVQRAGMRVPDYRETQQYVKTVLQLYEQLKPASSLQAAASQPRRVRMELPSTALPLQPPPPAGGASGRGNLPPALQAALPPTTATLQQD